jgi:plastocyanin
MGTPALSRRIVFRAAATVAVVAVGLGCSPYPPPGAPSADTKSVASTPKPPAAAPKIVGAVLSGVKNPPGPPDGGGVVYLEDAPKRPGVAMTAEVDVYHKEFTPFIAVVTTGGTVTFGNKDALTHHVFSPDLEKWDTGYLRQNESAVRRFDSPGPIALLCNIHPEMIGYVLVIPSTYFGRVDGGGRYSVADVPEGTYRVTAWAPRMQTVTQSVTVGPTGKVTANFELRPAAASN